MFKSYYVVWKLGDVDTYFLHILFKSYYVVWKLDIFVGGEIFIDMFKSYYVVWKLHTSTLFSSQMICLNRTMQYGNEYNHFFSRQHQVCLNRTMQYGNFSIVFVLFYFLLFKSYYVVWKPFFEKKDNQKNQKFKSYYVVWKLWCCCHFVILFYCLNRTMQYGNE